MSGRSGSGVEQCDVGLADCAVTELLLQVAVGVARLRRHHQSAGAHIKTVSQQCAGVALTQDSGHTVTAYTTWHAKQPRRLVEYYQHVVLIDYLNIKLWCSQ